MEEMTANRIVADEVCGDLQEFFKETYGFTIDDIYISDDPDGTNDSSRFTNEFLKFCFTLARRKRDYDSLHRSIINEDALHKV